MTHLQEVQLGRSITSLFFASAGSRGPPTTTPLHPPPRTRLQHRIHQFNDLWCLNTVGGVGRQMSNWDTTTLCCSAAQLANMLMLGGNHAGEAARPPRQQLSPLLAPPPPPPPTPPTHTCSATLLAATATTPHSCSPPPPPLRSPPGHVGVEPAVGGRARRAAPLPAGPRLPGGPGQRAAAAGGRGGRDEPTAGRRVGV